MSVVAQRYGYSVQYEVLNDKVGAGLHRGRQRGQAARRRPAADHAEGGRARGRGRLRRHLRGLSRRSRSATWPRPRSSASTTEVADAAIDKTLDILRKQRRTFQQRPAAEPARRRRPRDDRLRRQDRRRAVRRRQGRGLPVRHRRRPDARAVRRRRARHEGRASRKTFPLQFPADYQGKDVAGKEADFMVTLKKIEAQHLPEVDEALRQVARHRGRHGRGAARRHPQEPRARGQVPRPGAQQGERDGRAGQGRRARGAEGAGRRRDRAHGRGRARRPEEARHEGRRHRADPGRDVHRRRPRSACASAWWSASWCAASNLQAKPEQLQAHIEELSQSYEKPAEVMRWYLERPPAHGRGRGAWWSRTTSPTTCSSAPR